VTLKILGRENILVLFCPNCKNDKETNSNKKLNCEKKKEIDITYFNCSDCNYEISLSHILKTSDPPLRK
jgi:hypothetical protein